MGSLSWHYHRSLRQLVVADAAIVNSAGADVNCCVTILEETLTSGKYISVFLISILNIYLYI